MLQSGDAAGRSGAPAIEALRMSELDPTPHITGNDLRAALARDGRPRRRRSALLEPTAERDATPSAPAWDWETGLTEEHAAVELRADVDRLEAELRAARQQRDGALAEAARLRAGLARVGAARPWRRGRVLAELRADG
jgi:hypothetical protein